MVISQLMLTGFVAYWLASQYRAERNLLSEDLARLYDDSQSQVIDSLLMKRVVDPALKDSVTITMMTADVCDTVVRKRPVHIFTQGYPLQDSPERNPKFMVKLADSARGLHSQPAETYGLFNKKKDILIRSVKLFINHSGDSTSSVGAFPGYLPGNPDTALFRKVYLEKIRQKNLGVTVTWTPDTVRKATNVEVREELASGRAVETVEHHQSGMVFTSMFPNNLPGVQIRNSFPHLVRRITPQILFGLILLLLTGSAFLFTNRSLNRQMMLNALRNDFVSNITHELKTPVSTVKVAIEALKTFDRVKDPAVTREYLDMAGLEMTRLDQLITKVLDQSLIGEKDPVIQVQPMDLKELIHQSLLALQPRLVARKATLKFENAAAMDPVPVDPLHFQGVLTNLIDNSLKYGPEAPEILIRLWQDHGSAYVEVSDNGPGIPKQYLDRVFDKFFRVPAGDTHNIKGYGLGLSFAALVMKQHRGSISVKNTDPRGCAFTLRFPRLHA
jgi:signal transduction histidine kinase